MDTPEDTLKSAREIARERLSHVPASPPPGEAVADPGQAPAADAAAAPELPSPGEGPAIEAAEAAPPEAAAPTAAQIDAWKTAAARADEYLLLLQRERADFSNYQRRLREEAPRREAMARRPFVLGVIEIIDDLDRALASAEGRDDPLVAGVRHVAQKVALLLAEHGIVPIEPRGGERLDPARHEAVAGVESDLPPGAIVRLVEKGYAERDGTLLRPARVVAAIARPSPPAETEASPPPDAGP